MSAADDVRKAAGQLLAAINAAQAAGYVVQWPSRPAGLAAIAISATGAVAMADAVAAPLDLTDEERAALPALDPHAPDDPAQHVAATSPRRNLKK